MSPRVSVTVMLAIAAIAVPSARAQVRTVMVSPVPGDPVASGNALVAALASIPGVPSDGNQWQVKLEPGDYEIASPPLQMREWVTIVGSGPKETVIGNPNLPELPLFTPLIRGASATSLRDLSINVGGSSDTRVIAVGTGGAVWFEIDNVVIYATGGFETCGLRVEGSSSGIDIDGVNITVAGSQTNYGLLVTDGAVGVSLRRAFITVSDGVTNYGAYVANVGSLIEIRDSEIAAKRGGANRALFYHGSAGNQGTVTISNTEIDAVSGSGVNAAVTIETGGIFKINNSDLAATGGTQSFGALRTTTGAVVISNSVVSGTTATVSAPGPGVGIRATSLHGGPVGETFGSNICAGVWDEAGVFYASTCPP